MKSKFVKLLVLFFVVIFTCCSNGKLSNKKIVHNGYEREYKIYIPNNIKEAKEPSLVFMLHGHGSSSDYASKYGFNNRADELGFIMIYPQGLENTWDYNDLLKVDDVGFIEKLIDLITNEYSIDINRVYAAGRSIGGFMAYKLALELPDKVSAISSISGLSPIPKRVDRLKPVSVMHIHAQDDRVVRLAGYPNESLSLDESLKLWSDINGIKAKNKNEVEFKSLKRTNGLSDKTGKRVLAYRYERGGHGWLPNTLNYVTDFFYNTPVRDNSISIDLYSSKDLYSLDENIDVKLKLTESVKFESVQYYVNEKLVYTATDNNFKLKWSPKKAGTYQLKVKGILVTGEVQNSPTVLDFIVTKPRTKVGYSVSSPYYAGSRYIPDYSIDQDLSTYWESTFRKHNQSLTINLKETSDISGISLIWADYYPVHYIIETSVDGNTWDISYRDKRGKGGFKDIKLSQAGVKYIRLTCLKRANVDFGYSLKEIVVH